MHSCYVTYIIARARVHALCVLSGTFVGVRGIFVGVCVFACVRVSMIAYARARARVYAVCVRVHMYAHNIYPHCTIV